MAPQLGTLSEIQWPRLRGSKASKFCAVRQYKRFRALGQDLMDMIRTALDATGVAFQIVGDPTLFEIVFSVHAPKSYRDVQNGNVQMAQVWNNTLRANGIFKSAGKTYPSLALTKEDLTITSKAVQKAAAAIAELG